MNIFYTEIAEILVEEGMHMGRVKVGGAMEKVPLELLTDAKCGDTVLLCDGVAISKVRPAGAAEPNDVPGNPR